MRLIHVRLENFSSLRTFYQPGLVEGVIPTTDLAAVAEGAGVLAGFGTAVEIMAHSFAGGSWPKDRKGATMRKMVPTPTNREKSMQ